MKNTILSFIGLISLTLGVVGIFLPVLPTTPFVLLAGGCFSISSPRLSVWLQKSRFFGSYIENYEKKTGIPEKVKIKAIAFVWIGIILSMILNKNLFINCILLFVAITATIFLSRMKTKE